MRTFRESDLLVGVVSAAVEALSPDSGLRFFPDGMPRLRLHAPGAELENWFVPLSECGLGRRALVAFNLI